MSYLVGASITAIVWQAYRFTRPRFLKWRARRLGASC